MTNEDFNLSFCKEFPDYTYLYDEYNDNETLKNKFNIGFIQYLVEEIFELVNTNNDVYGFSGEKYSEEETGYGDDVYSSANIYTFEYLKENRHLFDLWLL